MESVSNSDDDNAGIDAEANFDNDDEEIEVQSNEKLNLLPSHSFSH